MTSQQPRDHLGAVPPAALFLLAAIALAWGSLWPVMKFTVGELPVFTFRALTALLSGAAVLALARLSGRPLALAPKECGLAIIAGLLNVTGWFYFSALALTLLPAGRASVLAYTMPVWVFLAGLAAGRDRATPRRLLGLAAGLGAIALLAGDDLLRLGRTPLGVAAILAGAASWGIGTVVQKRPWQTPLLTLVGWQLVIGGIPLAVLAGLYDTAPFARVTPTGFVALAFVILVGNVFGFAAWLRVVAMVPASVASLGTLPVPFVGVASSALILGEPVGWMELAALALTTLALASVLPLPRLAMLLNRGGIGRKP